MENKEKKRRPTENRRRVIERAIELSKKRGTWANLRRTADSENANCNAEKDLDDENLTTPA